MRTVTEPVVVCTAVHKAYGSRTVLRGLSLSVQAGESVALVGLNGAGKTTLLRCLLDFQRADQGTLTLHGHRSRDAAARAGLAFLPERFQAPAFLTGLEFLQLSARLHGQPWQADRAAAQCADLALAWTDLAAPVSRLSKGSGQKLGLAACLLSQKALYILDEPLSGLDVQARALAIRALLQLRKEGRTLLFTCHEPADIDVLCNRMALLHGGMLRFEGTPDQLRRHQACQSLEQAVLDCLASTAGSAQPAVPLAPA